MYQSRNSFSGSFNSSQRRARLAAEAPRTLSLHQSPIELAITLKNRAIVDKRMKAARKKGVVDCKESQWATYWRKERARIRQKKLGARLDLTTNRMKSTPPDLARRASNVSRRQSLPSVETANSIQSSLGSLVVDCTSSFPLPSGSQRNSMGSASISPRPPSEQPNSSRAFSPRTGQLAEAWLCNNGTVRATKQIAESSEGKPNSPLVTLNGFEVKAPSRRRSEAVKGQYQHSMRQLLENRRASTSTDWEIPSPGTTHKYNLFAGDPDQLLLPSAASKSSQDSCKAQLAQKLQTQIKQQKSVQMLIQQAQKRRASCSAWNSIQEMGKFMEPQETQEPFEMQQLSESILPTMESLHNTKETSNLHPVRPKSASFQAGRNRRASDSKADYNTTCDNLNKAKSFHNGQETTKPKMHLARNFQESIPAK